MYIHASINKTNYINIRNCQTHKFYIYVHKENNKTVIRMSRVRMYVHTFIIKINYTNKGIDENIIFTIHNGNSH